MRFEYAPPDDRRSSGVSTVIDLEGAFEGEHIIGTIGTLGTFYEADLLEHLAAVAPRGGIFVDVGANIGNHSVYFAKFLADRVVAIEADPSLLPVLRRNLEANGVHNVTVVGCGVGARLGAGTLWRRKGYEGNAGAGRVVAHYGALPRDGTVAMTTLDRVVDAVAAGAPHADVRLVKIDVEGMELEVLEGGRTVLDQYRPDVVAEAAGDPEHGALASFLTARGYLEVGVFCRTPTYHFTHPSRRRQGDKR